MQSFTVVSTYIYIKKNLEKLNILENHQMTNPTLSCIIHAYKLTENNFMTWTLCNKKSM